MDLCASSFQVHLVNGGHSRTIRDKYSTHSHTCIASDTFDTSEIPGDKDKLSRMDAEAIL
jgi:hypothetical protein